MAHVPKWLLWRSSASLKPCRQPLVREMAPKEASTNPAIRIRKDILQLRAAGGREWTSTVLAASDRFGRFRKFQATCPAGAQPLTPPADLAWITTAPSAGTASTEQMCRHSRPGHLQAIAAMPAA
jgi:hypothetical protein